MLNECPSRFTLVQFLAEDIPDDERRRIAEHAGDCPACQEMIESIETNVIDYKCQLSDHLDTLRDSLPPDVFPFPSFSETSEEGSGGERKPSSSAIGRTFKVLIPLAAAAAIALLFWPEILGLIGGHDSSSTGMEPSQSTILYKGRMITFEVVAKRGEHQFKVEPGTVLFPGDSVRFVISTESAGYLSVLSIDSHKKVSPFYPATDPSDDPSPLVIEKSGLHELPGSVLLDDAMGSEILIVVFSKNKFSRSDLFNDLKKMGVDRLSELGRRHNLQVRSLEIIKKLR